MMKTLGGRQFWGDVTFFRGWRIQRNVFTGHYRLLDPADIRHTFGSLAHCRERLAAIRSSRELPPMSGKAAIALHGLIRSSKTFGRMRPALERAGYTVVPFDYPSTRLPIAESAEYLHRVIESLDGIEQIDLVVHSLGGLIVRAYLMAHRDRRIGRMVMLGVPNQGAELADHLRGNVGFRLVFGPAGQQLVTDGDGVASRLPVPDFPFAVIAGARGHAKGFNPLISGDDDLVVTVESARLAGAADFRMVRTLHAWLPANPQVIASTVRFLQTGRLDESAAAQSNPPVQTDSAALEAQA